MENNFKLKNEPGQDSVAVSLLNWFLSHKKKQFNIETVTLPWIIIQGVFFTGTPLKS